MIADSWGDPRSYWTKAYGSPECPVVSNPRADTCRLHKPGHLVHMTQLKMAIRSPLYPVEILAVSENCLYVRSDQRDFTLYTHRPEQIQELLHFYGPGLIGWVHDKWFFECQGHLLCVTSDVNEFDPCSVISGSL